VNRYHFTNKKAHTTHLTDSIAAGQIWVNQKTGLQMVMVSKQGSGDLTMWNAYCVAGFQNRMDIQILAATLLKECKRKE